MQPPPSTTSHRRPPTTTVIASELPMWWLVALLVMTWGVGCSGDDQGENASPPPLQPLTYTEDPELTPGGAAVREQRLRRQLLEGAASGHWGTLEDDDGVDLPALNDPDALGEAITEALICRDEQRWEQVFVSDEAYRQLVNVSPARAAEFVDNQIGASLALWELFAPTRSSEVPEGGLQQQLEFQGLELGSARDIDGSRTSDDADIAQYWNNAVHIYHGDADVTFELSIPRIFRIASTPDVDTDGEFAALDDTSGADDSSDDNDPMEFRVGSQIEADPRFETMLDVGLHLKPQLLRTEEYAFPLGIGSFWRYRRYHSEEDVNNDDILERRFDEQPRGVSATEVIVEVRDVSRYGSIRLIEMLHSYDDRRRTRHREWWVLTPRHIYRCSPACRRRIDDVNWLLGYFDRQTPIMTFPIQPAERWGMSEDGDAAVFTVDDQWHEIETPAGTFGDSARIEGTGPLGTGHRYISNTELTQYFAPGRGIVRREMAPLEGAEESATVIEELVEYRIMD